MIVTDHAQERIKERFGKHLTKEHISKLASFGRKCDRDKISVGLFGKQVELVVKDDTIITAYHKQRPIKRNAKGSWEQRRWSRLKRR